MVEFIPFGFAVLAQILVLFCRFKWAPPTDRLSTILANVTTFLLMPAFVILVLSIIVYFNDYV